MGGAVIVAAAWLPPREQMRNGPTLTARPLGRRPTRAPTDVECNSGVWQVVVDRKGSRLVANKNGFPHEEGSR